MGLHVHGKVSSSDDMILLAHANVDASAYTPVAHSTQHHHTPKAAIFYLNVERLIATRCRRLVVFGTPIHHQIFKHTLFILMSMSTDCDEVCDLCTC